MAQRRPTMTSPGVDALQTSSPRHRSATGLRDELPSSNADLGSDGPLLHNDLTHSGKDLEIHFELHSAVMSSCSCS